MEEQNEAKMDARLPGPMKCVYLRVLLLARKKAKFLSLVRADRKEKDYPSERIDRSKQVTFWCEALGSVFRPVCQS